MPAPLPSTPLIALDAVAVDTETTGLDVRTARLIQFGAVRIAGGTVRSDDRIIEFVDPGIPIPAASSQVHGITDREIAGAPKFPAIVPTIEAFLGDALVIGHTIAYDMAILRREYALARRPWNEPRTLDIRQLARVAAPSLGSYDLDSVCRALGIKIERRHSAIGDAMAAAEAFVALEPHLRARGIRTLAEAEAACRAVMEQEARTGQGTIAREPSAPANDRREPLMRVDSFPYRHRVRDVMSAPPVTALGTATFRDAAAVLLQKRVSSVFVASDTRGIGIVTERDVLRAIATLGPAALDEPLETFTSRPLHVIGEDDFVYRAIGRMDRLSIRHLGVVDKAGTVVGALTTRNLLRHRASTALALGDQIDSANDAPALARSWGQVPAMAQTLAGDDVDARLVSAVISAEICAMTRRAAEIGERRLAAAGHGAPPTDYAVMVLGSAGRGESLLAADQDHAIVYAEGEPGGAVDRWFETLGQEISTILDEAGIPLCKGGVMSKNAAWRMSVADWTRTVDRWITRQRPEDLLNVDIFFDAVAVHGSPALLDGVLDHAYGVARKTRAFIVLLSESARRAEVPLTLFRNLRTDSDGRIDLKRHGLFPLVAGARVLAIKHGVRAHATPERLKAMIAAGAIGEGDGTALIDAHRTILAAMLSQQLIDGTQGVPLGTRVAPDQLATPLRAQLKGAVTAVATMNSLVSEGRF